ncbi:hypothetical protein PHET_06764 [Paragonimus heterotremus]|uniref:Uncharacterized protein n=1 Tax=Paragonimus heterotremus TaxID=100268 RepID=A0A8J4THZ3_9TREM|nr:hypothetical protein PHET_06764 [Paragonimus heterotremus]
MICSYNCDDAEVDKENETQRTKSSCQDIRHTVPDVTSTVHLSQTETDSNVNTDSNHSSPRILWKAYIQTPVRLTETDAGITGRPGFFGLYASSSSMATRNIQKTIRDYKLMLPNISINDDIETRSRADSKVSGVTSGGRTVFSSSTRVKRAHRFLKTLPNRTSQFLPLQRSKPFENFLKSRLQHQFAHKIESKDTQDNSVTATHDSSTYAPLIESKRTATASESDGSVADDSRTVQQKASVTSLESQLRRLSLFKQSLATISAKYPIAPFRINVRRSLAKLQSLRDDQIQTMCTGMVDGITVRLHNDRYIESESSDNCGDALPSSTSVRQSITKNQRSALPHLIRPNVIDLDTLHRGSDILEAKVRDYDLHISIDTNTADEMRNLYTITILNEPTLRGLLKSSRLDALPKSLRHLVRLGSLYRQREPTEKGVGECEALERQKHFCAPRQLTADTAIGDAENLWIEAKVFTSGLFANWLAQMKPKVLYGQMSVLEFDIQLRRVAKSIRANSSVATSECRAELSGLLATCVVYPKHLPTLWSRMFEWLDNLLSGLFSRERTVREETCYILAYLFTEPLLVEGVRQCSTIDIGFDVTVAILNAMQLVHQSFIHFYCLLALMIEGCPMFSILNAIMEYGPISNSVLVNHLWPRLLYYALKYWHNKQFLRDRLLLKMLNDSIERAYVRGISKKNAKLAQIQLSRRFKVLTKPTTIWLDEWKKFKL